MLLYVIDGKPYVLSLNDNFIRKGDNLQKINDLRNPGDMNYRLCERYDEYKKDNTKKDKLLSLYESMIKCFESQLLDKEDVLDFIENLTERQFAELEKQVEMFCEINQLSKK